MVSDRRRWISCKWSLRIFSPSANSASNDSNPRANLDRKRVRREVEHPLEKARRAKLQTTEPRNKTLPWKRKRKEWWTLQRETAIKLSSRSSSPISCRVTACQQKYNNWDTRIDSQYSREMEDHPRLQGLRGGTICLRVTSILWRVRWHRFRTSFRRIYPSKGPRGTAGRFRSPLTTCQASSCHCLVRNDFGAPSRPADSTHCRIQWGITWPKEPNSRRCSLLTRHQSVRALRQ